MTLDDRLENVSIIGAAGKMGSGITVLIAQEMAKLKLKTENRDKVYRLNLIDVNERALDGLQDYIGSQVTKAAERAIVSLRALYSDRSDLVENSEIIDAFVTDTFKVIRTGTDLGIAKNSKIVFEAIVEDEDVKIKVLKELNKMCSKDTLYFTNTSSIPIGFLDDKAKLDGRIIGYHFYNPPIVQRLVEVITAKSTCKELKEIGAELGKRLGKKLVPANDISGFIGNGHFMRDGLHAISEVKRLKDEYSLAGAIYIMNRISQDFLIRPMGIFQLIDYVGVDVFKCILKVMRKHLEDNTLQSNLIDLLVSRNILGGQKADGSQKDGFLKYDKNRPVAVYDPEKQQYVPIEGNLKQQLDSKIGDLPNGFSPWRKLLADPAKENKFSVYFNNLKASNTFGAELARAYLTRTKEIAKKLVKDRVANSDADVNAVLTNGFYWLYGPINNYI
ncbi:MAG: 3-hydroxyacyl-CoA dehydrogenase family protein [bacterium]|nr:3-hydroxyacyl-CoA dehydrogenase family protein [bacterium]